MDKIYKKDDLGCKLLRVKDNKEKKGLIPTVKR